MAKIDFGGVQEEVVTREEFTLENALDTLKNETIAVIGYGVQGPGQSLNLKDNGFNVIVGQRKGTPTWDKAVADGWVPGETLFEPIQAVEKGTIIANLLSDAAQIELWPQMKPLLTEEKTLYFSHGFAIAFNSETNIEPPENIDVILVAPKGSGTSLRRLFLAGKGINSSIAVYQDATGKAWDKVKAMGIGVGSGYLFETTIQKEAQSDLTGERGVLIGAIAGLMEAQYNLLRQKGHSPSEAFNETVEEATESLFPMIGENGMDWMLANVSTTAQRGALDWKDKFRDAVAPVFRDLYASVEDGKEARRTIDKNSQPDYREKLEEELTEIRESEMWRAGAQVRKLRPQED